MLRQLALLVLVGVAYAALGRIGLAFAVVHDNVSLIGPAAGLALSAVWLGGFPAALGVLAGAVALHLAAGAQATVAIGLALASTLGAAVGVWLLRGVLRFDPAFGRVRDVVSLVAAGACASAVLAATIGSATLFLGDHAAAVRPMELWLTWWAGDTQGILLVAPCVLGWARRRQWDKGAWTMLALLAAVLVVAALLTLAVLAYAGESAALAILSYAILPLAVWPAMRLGSREAATVNLALALAWHAALLLLPEGFSGGMLVGSLVREHAFLVIAAVTTMALAAAGAERRRAAAELAASEARYRGLTELSADWYWEQDREFRYTHLSDTIFHRARINPADYLGRRQWEIPGIVWEPEALAEHRAILDSRQPYRDLLVRAIDAEGRVHYLESDGNPTQDAGGTFSGYCGVGRDVTTRVSAERSLRESEARYSGLFHNASADICLFSVDPLGEFRCEALNPAAARRAATSSRDAHGRKLGDYLPEPVAGVLAHHYRRCVDAGQAHTFEESFAMPSGHCVLLTTVVPIRAPDGAIRRLESIAVDVTARREAELSDRRSQGLLSAIYRSSPLPISITRKVDGSVLDVNEAWVESLGGVEPAPGGVGSAPSAREAVAALAARGALRDFAIQVRAAGGATLDMVYSSHEVGSHGEPLVVATLVDVSEANRAARRIEELATRDPLTGLPNRALLGDRIGRSLAIARRGSGRFAVLFIDLDQFKSVNDNLGHAAGDALLVEVAARLSGVLREADTLARPGGDEFVVLLDNPGSDAAAGTVAEKLLDAVSRPVQVAGTWLRPTCSIGLSIYPRDGTDGDALMRRAEIAMYAAKEGGRRAYRHFSPELNPAPLDIAAP